MNAAMQELQKLTEAVGDMLATCSVLRGRHPEEDDILTHEQWAEIALAEAFTSANVLIHPIMNETQA